MFVSYSMCVCIPTEARKGHGYLGAGVTGFCELPDLLAGFQALVL